jgi:thiamine pyrophosphate-dependent acetolactate synthase large subunit-like protein
MADLLTAVKHNMNITHVLLNNGQLGKISKEQRAGDWEVWQTSRHNPDFWKYADIRGALGIRVTKPSQLDEVLHAAPAHDAPSLIEIVADPDLI